jgi:hypothetical protein
MVHLCLCPSRLLSLCHCSSFVSSSPIFLSHLQSLPTPLSLSLSLSLPLSLPLSHPLSFSFGFDYWSIQSYSPRSLWIYFLLKRESDVQDPRWPICGSDPWRDSEKEEGIDIQTGRDRQTGVRERWYEYDGLLCFLRAEEIEIFTSQTSLCKVSWERKRQRVNFSALYVSLYMKEARRLDFFRCTLDMHEFCINHITQIQCISHVQQRERPETFSSYKLLYIKAT